MPDDESAIALPPMTHVVLSGNVTLQQALDRFAGDGDVWLRDF